MNIKNASAWWVSSTVCDVISHRRLRQVLSEADGRQSDGDDDDEAAFAERLLADLAQWQKQHHLQAPAPLFSFFRSCRAMPQHPFLHSFMNYSFIHSFMGTPCIHSFIRSFLHSFMHSFLYSLTPCHSPSNPWHPPTPCILSFSLHECR